MYNLSSFEEVLVKDTLKAAEQMLKVSGLSGITFDAALVKSYLSMSDEERIEWVNNHKSDG